MKLDVLRCSRQKKSDIKKMKVLGEIPAIIYKKGQESEKVRISKKAFEAVLRQIEQGHLATTKFELSFEGATVPALIKGIEYNKTTYDVIHLDFQEIVKGEVKVKVPVVLIGANDCEAVKAGFSLKLAKRHLQVVCKVEKIPTNFEVNVQKLQPREKIRVKDLNFNEGVTVLADTQELIVTASK